MTTAQADEQGALSIPPELLREIGVEPNSHVFLQKVGGWLVIRPAEYALEDYTPERQAEFLLNNAVDGRDYAAAAKLVREMGIDPDQIEHERPAGV
jgi:hypothetical protein